MVEVLLAAAGVAAKRLQRRAFGRTDPDIAPGGRDGEGADALEGRFRRRLAVACVAVREAPSLANALDPRRTPAATGCPRARSTLLRTCGGGHWPSGYGRLRLSVAHNGPADACNPIAIALRPQVATALLAFHRHR